MVSKSAKAENFSNASVGLGTSKYHRVTADVNRTMGDNAAVRLNLMGHENHVAGHNKEVYGDRWGFAPSVAFGLTGPTKVNLSYYHYKSSELPDAGVPFDNPFTTGANVAKSETFYGLVDRDFRDTKSDIGTIDIKHEFGNGLAFRNVTRYGKTGNEYVYTLPDDSKGNVVLYGTVWRRHNSRNVETESLANASSLTGSLVAAGIKHSFTTGVEVSREVTDRATYLFSPGTNNPLTKTSTCPTAGAATLYNCTTLVNPNPYDPWTVGQVRSVAPNDTNVHSNSRSVYGFDTIEFNPQWLLNVGLRWDEFRTRLHTNANTAVTPVVAAINAENKSTFANYQAGLVYKPAANSSIYVSYGTSSTPPGNDGGDGVDGLTVAIQNLKPQDSKNFELGTKWEILARKLSVSGAIFASKMNNARVTVADGTTQNVGEKKVKGVELGVSGALTANWQVFGGYTWLDAESGDNCFVNFGTSAAPNYKSCTGNAFPATPKQSASLWTSYTLMQGLVIGGGVNAVSKIWSNNQNTKFVPGYTRWDAMASYDVNKNISLQLNIQNLTDKLYYDKVGSNHYAGVGVGRTAILTANFRY
jgi:catecholate siderophore receptor